MLRSLRSVQGSLPLTPMSAIGASSEDIYSIRVIPVLTPKRTWRTLRIHHSGTPALRIAVIDAARARAARLRGRYLG